MIFWYCIKIMSEDLENSVNQYFPNDWYIMLPNWVWVKKSIQSPRKTNGLKLTSISSSIWLKFPQLNLKKLPLSNCVTTKRNIYNHLNRQWKYSWLLQLNIFVRLNFLQILQPKQHITANWMQKQIQESNCILLSQTLQRL